MKKTVTCAILIVAVLCSAFAAKTVRQLLPQIGDYANLLIEGETLSNSTLADGVVHIVPRNSLIHQRALTASEEENSFTVGIVALAPYPAGWETMSDNQKAVALLNIMTAVSRQKGITYISRTAGYKPKTLIEESYCISDPGNTKSRIDDPSFSELPKSFVQYSYQKDNRFGGNTFVLDYNCTDEEIFLKITNYTDMKFGIVNCVPAGKLSMYIDAHLAKEGVLVSCLATVYDREPTIKVLFYTVDIEESFRRRITGLKDWFVEELK